MSPVAAESSSTPQQTHSIPHGQLGLWDTVSIIIGIVIGSSIFTTATTIFGNLPGPWEALGIWFLCGVLSLVGALCYAELATTYPRAGGDYVYLTRAFGRPVGFLFGWAQLVVILSGSTGMMAFIFGEYCANLFQIPSETKMAFTVEIAVAAVAGITLMNFFGVVLGKWVQNLLVLVKLVGLGAIVVAGLMAGSAEGWVPSAAGDQNLGVAVILVLYAYGGWNDAAFVASDMRDRRLIPKALILSTIGITLIYLAVNAAYILSLGFPEVQKFKPAIAADVLRPMGAAGFKVMCLVVMVSALGAMNGLIFTGSRVYSSLGAEHSVFALLGHWQPRFRSPVWSLLAQGAITVAMIFMVGTQHGRDSIDYVLSAVGIAIPWGQYFGGFNTLFAGTAPVFWVFFLLTGVSVFVLRIKDRDIERPFRLAFPWFPVLPLIFCGMCVFGFYSAINYAKSVSLIGWVPLLLGLPLFFLSRSTSVETNGLAPSGGIDAPHS